MEWNNDEPKTNSEGMSLSSKILLAIIVCVIAIIILIFMLLMNLKNSGTNYSIEVDGKKVTAIEKEALLTTLNNKTYIDIEEFAKLVSYVFHKGEYKSNIIEENKCYVVGKSETSSFYSDDNKVYKLPVKETDREYNEYIVENQIKTIQEKMYAPLEAISVAFNVVIDEKDTYFKVYTLDYLVSTYDSNVIQWGYEQGIKGLSFENKKALLQGYLIVEENGLFKVIDINNTKEIIPARYTSIEFSEIDKKFTVVNNSKKVGIINLDGTIEIEPKYESISLLDKESNLYIIEQDNKYGVVKSGNTTIIFPEYEKIGVDNISINNNSNNKKMILDELIPIYKDKKWGASDKQGNIIIPIEYDSFGYILNNVQIGDFKKEVDPILAIKRCNGIVVKKDDKYGLIDITGKQLVTISVDGIYALKNVSDEEVKYVMLYKDQELNVIKILLDEGLIEESENIIDNITTENVLAK